MSYTRTYQGGTSDYAANGRVVQINYAILGVDGASVNGQLDASLLTDDQLDLLCDALQKAGALLTWAGNIGVMVIDSGRRTFTVAEDAPPVNP